MFATGLMLATAIISSVAVLVGFESESRRRQEAGALEVLDRVTRYSEAPLESGQGEALAANVARMASRSEVARVSVRDAQGQLLAARGEAGRAEEAALAGRALRRGGVQEARMDGQLAVAEPIISGSHRMGAAVVIIKPDGFRYNAMLALTPFFLALICFLMVAIPAIILVIRRALLPLEALTRFAHDIAEQGEAAPITLKTGDEFEVLALAFNNMIERLQASMRKIQQIAFVDPATQLPNQERFQRELGFYLSQADAATDLGAVLTFDFQRMPRLMQTLDPDTARGVTRVIAERFLAAVRTVDRQVRLQRASEAPALAARLGAHEFGVLVAKLASPQDAVRLAQQLTAALDQPLEWNGDKVLVGPVCGVALLPRDGREADVVLRNARIAQVAANAAPGRVKPFTPSLDRAAVRRLTLEREIRTALDNNEFRAFFQPKVNLASARIEGAEALARWVRADGVLVSPARFIPAAEENGLVEPLSNAILREACWKAAAWARAGFATHIAVNVSALQFRNERFAEQVLHVIEHAGLPTHLLELEITETVAMEDPARTLKLIERLREAGVRLAIDDFGCGHSSLAVLSQLPFDVIKIDRQFVAALDGESRQGGAIVDMILAMAGTLGLSVVAEGVERRDQAEFLAARGCQWGQGFLYSPAVPPEEFLRLLVAQRSKAEHAA